MDTLAHTAADTPDLAAAIVAETGDTLTYAELHARSARLARSLAARLSEGETIAVLMGNRLAYFEVCFGARRAGLYYVPVSTHLTAGELAYILQDSGTRVLYTENACQAVVDALPDALRQRLQVVSVDGDAYRAELTTGPVPPLPERPMGLDFAYSSGTTGKPKGIKPCARQATRQLEQDALAERLAGWRSSTWDGTPACTCRRHRCITRHRCASRCAAWPTGGTVVVLQQV